LLRDVPRRRILVLTSRNPYPVIGGDRLRVHRIARELSKHHDLTLLTLCRSEKETVAPIPEDGVFRDVHRVVLPAWRSVLNAAKALSSSDPLQVAYYHSSRFREMLQRLAPEHDVALAHLIRTAEHVRDLPTVRVLDMSDALSMSMHRIIRSRGEHLDIRRLFYGIEARRLLAHERRIAREFDLVTLTSQVDADYVFESGSHCAKSVMIMANGADIPAHTPPPQSRRTRNEIAFVGNLQSLQNFDGLWFFARHVLPRVRRQHPDTVLRVIGHVRPMARRRLAALPGVQVEGFIPNLSAALATARIGVCPIRLGAGVKNKVLDYFANRLAVVSTSCGLEGLEARPNEHLLVADSVDEWLTQITRLLDDDLAAQRFADAGRELVRARYRWDNCVDPLVARLNKLLAERPAVNAEADVSPASRSLRA
jgi:glycosyltransferase involved in cell wall biosynthesis